MDVPVKTLSPSLNPANSEKAKALQVALAQIEKVTQTSASSAEQSAAVGHELTSEADTLRAVVENLTLLTGAG